MAARHKRTARTHAIADYALRRRMAFEAKDTYGIIRYFKDMKLFSRGGRKQALHLLYHKKGFFDHSGAFDYHYTVSTGKSSKTFKQTVYFMIDSEFVLPDFKVFPQRWYHGIGKLFGLQDIDFTVYPEFSKRYLLQGAQPEFIWTLFQDDALIRHFEVNNGWSVEAVGKYFVMYHANRLHPVPDLPELFRTGNRLYKLLQKRNAELESKLK
jgi:hypothetical protein